MRNDPTLTILNLNHVGIGSSNKHCHLLAMALSHNTHLIVLFLNNNDFNGSSLAFFELCKSIGRHPTLSFLYMSYNGAELGDVGATVLAQHALQPSPPPVSTGECHRQRHGLRVLKLAHNNIGPVGAKALAEALKLQSRQRQRRHDENDACRRCYRWGLQSLVLEHNRLGESGTLELAHAMRYNACLVSLNVRHNQVSALHDVVTRVQAGFLDSLRRDNCTLSELVLLDGNNHGQNSGHSKVGRELQYHIDWNRLGRQFFGDATIPATAWTRVLAKAASVGTGTSSFSGLQPKHNSQQHHVKNAPPPLPPPSPSPSLLFTTLRARPDLLQRQQQPQEQQQQQS